MSVSLYWMLSLSHNLIFGVSNFFHFNQIDMWPSIQDAG